MTHPQADQPRVSLLLAHPRPDSLCHALAERARAALSVQGVPVDFHDLYAERFDPILRADEAYTSGAHAHDVVNASADPLLALHRAELSRAAALLVVHPNWWGKPPAILAGWMDRVLVPGVAYRLDDAGGSPQPLLSLRRLLVVNTSDTEAAREAELFGDPLELIWKRCLPPYLGEPAVERLVLRVVADADDEQRALWLDQVAERAARILEPS